MNIRAGSVFTMDPGAEPERAIRVTVPLGEADAVLNLAPRSVRAAGFELLVQVEGGAIVAMDQGPVRTMRGVVEGVPGSSVAGSLLDDGLHANVLLPDGTSYFIEPLTSVANAAANTYVAYRHDDVVPSGGTCTALNGAQAVAQNAQALVPDEHEGGAAGSGGPFYLAELACEADVEYFQDYGSVAGTQGQIENIINLMNNQFETQVMIQHVITVIVVRTLEPDPYTNSDAETLLNQFRATWNSPAPPSDAEHDVAQLFTGKNLNGTTIGIAWTNGVCTSNAYSVVESNCCASTACKTDLSAHELGHNWDAHHCCPSGCSLVCPLSTMNPNLACMNDFSDFSIDEIVDFRNSRVCLNFDDPLLRIMIHGPTALSENTVVQYTAVADYLIGADQDVTGLTEWSVDPPEAGFFSANGFFTASNVNGDVTATIHATYFDSTGQDSDMREITIFDVDTPDPRTVTVVLVPSVDPQTLCPGQSFTADIMVSAPDGDIADVRLVQFDSESASGLTIDEFEWTFDSLVDSSLYLTFQNESVYTATYVALNAIPGRILTFSAVPQLLGRAHVTVTTSGALDLCGVHLPPTTDESFRVLSGFQEIGEFSEAIGNVSCSGVNTTVGECSEISIVSTSPPDEAVDARQPSELNGANPVGWDSVVVTFSGSAAGLTADAFTVSVDPPNTVPTISSLDINGNTATLHFDSRIPLGSWTTVTHVAGGGSVRIGHLPADVNGDGTSGPLDVLALIDYLNGLGNLAIWQTDINRSGLVEPTDVLRVVDLLNGADGFDAWNGASLP